ncbi:MAG: cytochrome c biogenesis protein CcsA, partial [Chitinispirillaceae bacterium]|nr:cytochrome c biogenesis protein CcsA [Chitinispirillaceae bacterium]
MDLTGVSFFWLSFAAYSAACLLYVVFLAFEKKWVSTTATVCMAIGLVLQTIALILRSIYTHHLPLTNMFEYLGTFAWFAAVMYFVALKVYRQQIIAAFISPVIFMLMVSASLLPKEASQKLMPALQSYWLQIHVTLAAMGEAAFAIGFAANIMYFMKKLLPESAGLSRRMPDLAKLDQVSYKSATIGYPLFTVGALFAGAIWAEQAWGTFWSWDPKEVGSLIVFLI